MRLAERAAQAYAAENDATWISPYNDGQVIAGQATVGMEILEQLHPLFRKRWLFRWVGAGSSRALVW